MSSSARFESSAWSRSAAGNVWVVLLLFVQTVTASQPDYLTYDEPTPESVADIRAPIDEIAADEAALDKPALLPAPEQLSPFWRDTSLDLEFRSYYFERDRDQRQDSLAWALGGWLAYRSGLWRERIGIGATLHTTQRLYGPERKPGSGLLMPVQQPFTVLGEAFVEVHLTHQTRMRLFRQTFDLPYVNMQDIRMVPNTFEAYLLADPEDQRFNYVLGQVTKIRTFDSDRFVSMSEAAGAADTDDGVSLIGARYNFGPTANIGAIDHYGHNTFNTFYMEATAAWDLNEDLGGRISGQYTHQQSVGDELAGRFDTSHFGIKADLGYRSGILTLAYTQTGDGSGVIKPWGSSPSYNSVTVEDFDRAGEKAWRLGLSFDFARIDWDGLSGFVNYTSGDTPDHGRNASNDQDELDFTLDYRPPDGMLQGLWLRARVSFVDAHGDGAQDIADYRLILNYDLPLL